jgi:hypothetical protein
VPALQPVQPVEPEAEAVAARHAAQLVWPELPWYWPPGQLVQLAAPVAAWYLPAGQGVQAVPPRYGWKRPAAHATHALAPEYEYTPVRQFEQIEAPTEAA